MTKRAFLLGVSLISALSAGLAGCGGNVVLSSGGGSGGGTSSAGNAGTAGSGGQTTTTVPAVCQGMEEIACLSAYPSCVPVYDDDCCPTCDPVGGCADCINMQFHHCDSFASQCTGAPTTCGTTPDWACKGGAADCANVEPGGSPEPCATVPGCLPAECSLELNSCTGTQCHPATAGSCDAQCKQTPPTCPVGTWPEAKDGCYTGYCIPENKCLIGL